MSKSITVLEGGIKARSLLESLIIEKNEIAKYLKPLVDAIDNNEKNAAINKWWITVDPNTNEPNGLLSVRIFGQVSFLEFAWTSVNSKKDFIKATELLATSWIKNLKSEVTTFYVEIAPNSGLISVLEKIGFIFDKPILSIYSIPTDYISSDFADKYLLRSPGTEELSDIYYKLIEPDLDKNSPIFITEAQFLNFETNFDQVKQHWLLIEDENHELVGFGASFLENRGKTQTPILYGPHAKNQEILQLLISEFVTHWKLSNFDSLRLICVNPIPNEIEYKFNMSKMDKRSIIRYKYLNN